MCKATRKFTGATFVGSFAAAGCLYIIGSTQASALSLSRTPASTAAARIAQAYGTNVALGPGLDYNRRVSFRVLDQSDLGGRTSAISYLAHQLDADRHTLLVVNPSNGNAWRAPQALDTAITLNFDSRTVPAREVLQRIAYVDNAGVEINAPISGDVVLPSTAVPATQAAYELAMQTHTTLAVDYRLTARNPLMATVPPPVENNIPAEPAAEVVVTHRSAHRVARYAHRRMRGSISITSAAPGPTVVTHTVTAPTGPPPIYGSPPATVAGPQPVEPSFNNPFTSQLNGGPFWNNYNYGYGYWNNPSPYTFGNGSVTVLPGYPGGGPTLVP